MPPQREVRHDDVDDEEGDRRDDRQLRDRVALGIPVERRDRRNQEQQDREADEPQRDEARLAVDLPAAAEDEREPEHEQEVPDDANR